MTARWDEAQLADATAAGLCVQAALTHHSYNIHPGTSYQLLVWSKEEAISSLAIIQKAPAHRKRQFRRRGSISYFVAAIIGHSCSRIGYIMGISMVPDPEHRFFGRNSYFLR